MYGADLAFWIAAFLLGYVYFGYPSLLALTTVADQRPLSPMGDADASVSLIIAAYNEEQVIARKVKNSLDSPYPYDKLVSIVFSDNSSDQTDEIVKSFVLLPLMHELSFRRSRRS